MSKKLTSILLCGVLILSLILLPVSAGLIEIPGEVGRINVALIDSDHNYAPEDFPGINIEKIEQYEKSLRIYIVEKTEEATDAAMEQIKVVLDGKYRYIEQEYKNNYVYSDDNDAVIRDGDANKDGRVNLTDVSDMMKYIAGWEVSISVTAADLDDTNTINLTDASILMKRIAN